MNEKIPSVSVPGSAEWIEALKRLDEASKNNDILQRFSYGSEEINAMKAEIRAWRFAAASACPRAPLKDVSTPAGFLACVAKDGARCATVIATVAPDQIAVRHTAHEGVEYLTFDIPNGWDDVKKVCKKALLFGTKKFTFSCWNSDRMECVFRWHPGAPEPVAKIVRK
jgi:hypothetical protein